MTAKLSQKFYERFGDDIANELVDWFNQVDATYRSDLRELNELNFQRFDAKLEQRVAASEARLDRRIAELRSEMQVGFANLETRFATLQAHLEERIGAQQMLFEERFDAQEGRLDKRLGAMDTRLDAMDTRLDAQTKWMFRYFVTTLIALGGLMIALHQMGG